MIKHKLNVRQVLDKAGFLPSFKFDDFIVDEYNDHCSIFFKIHGDNYLIHHVFWTNSIFVYSDKNKNDYYQHNEFGPALIDKNKKKYYYLDQQELDIDSWKAKLSLRIFK